MHHQHTWLEHAKPLLSHVDRYDLSVVIAKGPAKIGACFCKSGHNDTFPLYTAARRFDNLKVVTVVMLNNFLMTFSGWRTNFHVFQDEFVILISYNISGASIGLWLFSRILEGIPHHCCSLCRAPAFFDFPGDWERLLRPPCEESSLVGGFRCIQNVGMEIKGP